MMMARIGYLNLALAALLVICAIQLAYGSIRLNTIAPPEPREFSSSAFEVVRVKEQGSTPIVLNELMERPLFWSERRPYEPPVVVEPEKQPEKQPDPGEKVFKDTQLLGIYAGGQHPGVILLHKDKRIRLNQQDTLEGWTLDTLNERSAEFVSASERYRMEIQYPKVNFSQQPNN